MPVMAAMAVTMTARTSQTSQFTAPPPSVQVSLGAASRKRDPRHPLQLLWHSVTCPPLLLPFARRSRLQVVFASPACPADGPHVTPCAATRQHQTLREITIPRSTGRTVPTSERKVFRDL